MTKYLIVDDFICKIGIIPSSGLLGLELIHVYFLTICL